MRRLVILAAVLALAACGYRNFEKPDGTFDRDGYRRLMGSACSLGMAAGDSSISSETRSRVCGCMMDRMLQMSDEELRATVRDRALGERKQQEAGRACLVQLGLAEPPQPVFDPQTRQWVDPATGAPADPATLGGEAPPPEEPPPAPGMAGVPPPVVQPPHAQENQRTIKDAHSALENATREAEEAMRALDEAGQSGRRR